MKKSVLLFTALLMSTLSAMAVTLENAEDKVVMRNAFNYNNSFIFVENGVTFSVYPDGEFDFYINNSVGLDANVHLGRNASITFNTGFDYNPFVQYDDYGAVIQIENIPIYYDYYGRVTQIGDIDIRYNNGRLHRLGGMHIYYNHRGIYDYHRGYINIYNRNYVYRPFHRFFIRPSINLCLVRPRPYRRYYRPIRYTYYRPYEYNIRRSYAKVGNHYRYNAHSKRNKIYRNDKRVTQRSSRNYRSTAHGNRSRTTAQKSVRSNRDLAYNRTPNKRTNVKSPRNSRGVSKNNYKRGTSLNRSKANRTVTQRTVTHTPRTKTVTRSTSKTYRKPQARTSNRKAVHKPKARTVRKSTRTTYKKPISRSNSQRSNIKRSPSRTVRKSPARVSSRTSKSPSRSARSRR